MIGLIFRQTDKENHTIQEEASDRCPHRPQVSLNPYLTSMKTGVPKVLIFCKSGSFIEQSQDEAPKCDRVWMKQKMLSKK
jgi:hypothetical protein